MPEWNDGRGTMRPRSSDFEMLVLRVNYDATGTEGATFGRPLLEMADGTPTESLLSSYALSGGKTTQDIPFAISRGSVPVKFIHGDAAIDVSKHRVAGAPTSASAK
jgi:hypothetical protein